MTDKMIDINHKNDFMANNIIGFFMPAKIMYVIENGMNITQVYKKMQTKDQLTSQAGIAKSIAHLIDNKYIIKKQMDGKEYSKRDRYLFLTEKGKQLQKDVTKIYTMIRSWRKERD